ncbi:MAG: hypothetical protein OSB19_14935, partial [Opitutaceae bacterium]|nr:hypothetical protein [Opitutaceae bacterium]
RPDHFSFGVKWSSTEKEISHGKRFHAKGENRKRFDGAERRRDMQRMGPKDLGKAQPILSPRPFLLWSEMVINRKRNHFRNIIEMRVPADTHNTSKAWSLSRSWLHARVDQGGYR